MRRASPLRGLLASRRGRLGALVLSMLAFVAVFADFIASDAPVLLWSEGRMSFLPAVTAPARLDARQKQGVAAEPGAGRLALWPLLRTEPPAAAPRAAPRGPERGHPLGTDAFGRDALVRLVHGTRTALVLGAAATALALLLGCLCGSAAGLLGGYPDRLIGRLTEVVGVFPAVVLIALVQTLSHAPPLLTLVAIVALVRWAEVARLTRVLVLRALAEDWAEAARALGASYPRLAMSHIAPHVAPQVLVSGVFCFGSVVLTETSLSFLGLGVPSEVASWGEMLSEVRWGAGPGLVLPAAAALFVTLAGLYLLGDAVRETRAGSP